MHCLGFDVQSRHTPVRGGGGNDVKKNIEYVAANGLIHRRAFLRGGLALGGLTLMAAQPAAADRPSWMQHPGAPMSGYGARSRFEAHVQRVGIGAQPGTDGSGASRTPLERLNGTITPSGLHFERHHSGIPDIDPDQHRLIIHGLVERPLAFSMEALSRYGLVSRIQFLECSGNSGAMLAEQPADVTCSQLHGLVSGSEWTGVPLSALLEETGVKTEARWILAEGADAAMMSRSVPLAKTMDDAMIAMYQNGEALRPGNGYPIRLFLPGYEGNMSVKWLRRIKVLAEPAMTKDETSKYSDLRNDGTSELFTFPMRVKSVITNPSGGLAMSAAGFYEITGIAWSGDGRIAKVDVSADGGISWGEAALDDPVLPKALTRFRMAWRWDGGPAVLMSRATDETGALQPTRDQHLAAAGTKSFYHLNTIQVWRVAANGKVTNAYV